jgi:hypothetical protein
MGATSVPRGTGRTGKDRSSPHGTTGPEGASQDRAQGQREPVHFRFRVVEIGRCPDEQAFRSFNDRGLDMKFLPQLDGGRPDVPGSLSGFMVQV